VTHERDVRDGWWETVTVRGSAPPHPCGAAGTEARTLRIQLFGELSLVLDGRPLGPVESARARSLLGYLVLHRDAPQTRRRLAFLLWPDSTEAQARTNLRKVLHTLRRDVPELEQFLAITAQTVRWGSANASLDVDVEVFESALSAAAGAGDDAAAWLRRALASYAGELLEGCYDEWLIDVRERLRDQYASALARLAELLSERGDHVEAVRLGRELARREPMREASHRLLMGLYRASGDRAAAVRAYHECASTLQRELGVEPSRETVAAYAALTQASWTETDSHAVAAGPAALVGRDDEWACLTQVWREISSSGPRLVLVTGEPGVGKTRLVDELSRWCAHQGVVVAHGRSYPTEGELGFGLVISWLRDGLRDGVLHASRADAVELSRLLPELDPADEPRPEVGDDAEHRRRLFDATARVALSAGLPVLLIADDAQWSDTPSVQLLHYLLRFDPAAALLVVATVRREDLADSHAWHELVDSLTVTDRVTEIALDRLSRADTAQLARDLAGDDVTTATADALFAETEGNPLFIVESLRAGWSASSGRSTVSPRLQAIVTARVRQLTPPTRDLLGLASAVGRDFSVPLARDASRLDEAGLARALDEMWRRGLVREHGGDAYDFSHGRIRDVVYAGLEPAVRRHHHAVIAESLRRLHVDDVDEVSGQIAYHEDRAGRADAAIDWYRTAAVEAQRRYANAEAVRLLERAYQLVASLPDADRIRRELDVVSALPTPLAGVEGFASEHLAAVQQRVIEIADVLDVDPEPQVVRSLVMSRLCRDEFDDAVTAAAQLQDAARRTDDEGLLVESEYLLGVGAFWGVRLEAARDHFREVVERFRVDQRPEHLVRFGQDPQLVCLSRLANVLRFLGDTEQARRTRGEAVAMAEDVGHPFTRGVTLIFAALLAVDLGEADGVAGYVDALRRDPFPGRPNEIKTDALTGYAEVVAGSTIAGLQRIRQAIDRCGPVNHAPGFRAALLRLLVGAHLVAGNPTAGLAAADHALQLGGTRLWEVDVRVARARFLEDASEPAAMIDAELERAGAVARAQGAAGLLRTVDDVQRARQRAG
jgi:DNA-binding SARP family transcriptional activator